MKLETGVSCRRELMVFWQFAYKDIQTETLLEWIFVVCFCQGGFKGRCDTTMYLWVFALHPTSLSPSGWTVSHLFIQPPCLSFKNRSKIADCQNQTCYSSFSWTPNTFSFVKPIFLQRASSTTTSVSRNFSKENISLFQMQLIVFTWLIRSYWDVPFSFGAASSTFWACTSTFSTCHCLVSRKKFYCFTVEFSWST